MKRFCILFGLFTVCFLFSCTSAKVVDSEKRSEVLTRNTYDADKGVYYNIFVRAFADSDGDGIGDFNGIISKLDYLKELGITAIWFSPLYKSPDYDYGYEDDDDWYKKDTNTMVCLPTIAIV